MTSAWVPDAELPGFSCLTLPLAPDAGGRPCATLISAQGQPASTGAVVYIHGFVDYFFQDHLAAAVQAAGWDFYALDLRRYGRSLQEGEVANFCTDLGVYDEEIDLAIAHVKREHSRVVLMGHSTGGLIGPLWAARHPGVVDGLVLNSPWLELNESWLYRGPVSFVMRALGRVAPLLPVSSLDPAYGHSIHSSTGGEWGYNLVHKPLEGFPVRAGWLRAVRAGHRRVRRGLGIASPVLVCCAAAGGPNRGAHPLIRQTDSVLNPADIIRLAPRLGSDVQVVTFDGGIHDLSLAARPVREQYFRTVGQFLQSRAA